MANRLSKWPLSKTGGGGGGNSGVSQKIRLLFETINRLKPFKVRALKETVLYI